VPVIHAPGADPVQHLDPDLRAGAQAISFAVAARLRELAPALRPADDSGVEPTFVIDTLALVPDDPADAITVVACLGAHDTYATGRGRPGAVSPGALALARVLVWATRAEMLGARPDVRWIGPPARMPDAIEGQVITASVELTSGDTRARACAAMVVGRS
jgi:hypothetical protein